MNTNTTTSDTNLDILNGYSFYGRIHSDKPSETFYFNVNNEVIVGPKFIPDTPEYNIKDLGSYVFDMIENLIRREGKPTSMLIDIRGPGLGGYSSETEREITFGSSVTEEGFKEEIVETMTKYVEAVAKFLTEVQKTKLSDSDRWSQFENEPTSNTTSQPQAHVPDNILDNIILTVQADIVNGPSQSLRFFFENNKVLTQYFKSQMDLSAEEVGKFLVSKWGFSFQQKGWTVIFSVKAEHKLSGRIAGFLTDTFVFDTDRPEEENKIKLIDDMKMYVAMLKEQIWRDSIPPQTRRGAQTSAEPNIPPVFPGIFPYRDANKPVAPFPGFAPQYMGLPPFPDFTAEFGGMMPFPTFPGTPVHGTSSIKSSELSMKLSEVGMMTLNATCQYMEALNFSTTDEQRVAARDEYVKQVNEANDKRLELIGLTGARTFVKYVSSSVSGQFTKD